MSSDTNLRTVLVNLREKQILKGSVSEDDRRRCLLRRGMIDWLIAEKPQDLHTWWVEAPERLWRETDMTQFALYGSEVIKLVRMHSPGGVSFRV